MSWACSSPSPRRSPGLPSRAQTWQTWSERLAELHDRGWEPSVGGAAPGSKLVEPPAENITEAPHAAIRDLRQPDRTPEGRIAELERLEHHRPGRIDRKSVV